MCIVMGADTATNTQPAASPGRYLQAFVGILHSGKAPNLYEDLHLKVKL